MIGNIAAASVTWALVIVFAVLWMADEGRSKE